MIRALLTGTLYGKPEMRTGAAGKPYTLCKVLVDADGEKFFCSAIVFGEAAETVAAMPEKAAIALSGKLDAKTFQAKDGTWKVGLNIAADQAIGIKAKPRPKQSNTRHDSGFPAEAGDLDF